jgi:eukaryotic-like serine/threonine-protein kinase
MNAEPDEEHFASLLAACDDALAGGNPPPALAESDAPLELRQRIENNLPCLQLLRHLLPREPATESTPSPTDGALLGLDLGRPPIWLGRFRILRELGRGGFGIVMLADDPLLGRRVALKVPRAGALMSPDLRQRFLREAKAAARLDHPNLAPVYEAGAVGPICYIVSAYCPGPNLAVWLRERTEPPPARTAAALTAAVAEGVQHAHSCGVLHRDVKPSNILLPPEPEGAAKNGGDLDFTPRLTDFGLAKVLEEGADLTTTGVVMGSVPYMAPEQAEGRQAAVGPATDVYALGVILYELLTGQTPLQGDTLLATLDQVRSGQPVAPHKRRAGVPPELETICLKCLQKDPRDRYASAYDLAADLRSFLADKPIQARPRRWPAKMLSWCRGPERIRDAGVMAVIVAFFDMILPCAGMALMLAGQIPQVERSWSAFAYFLCSICGAGLPMIAIARYTLRQNVLALWAGLLLPFVIAAWLGSGMLRVVNSGEAGVIRDANLGFVACIAVGFVQGAQAITFFLALTAYYSNRTLSKSSRTGLWRPTN